MDFVIPPFPAMHDAPSPARGRYADGFEPLARTFAEQLARGEEVGAGLTVHHRGECVVDVWGGTADVATGRPWGEDTRIVVFSVTKGIAAMAFLLLADRGKLEWDAPVSTYWPGFARGGKQAVSVRTLLNHRAGLCALDRPFTLAECTTAEAAPRILEALEAQAPRWEPGSSQGYHALTYGMYARELFERIAGEEMGPFLERELFAPLGSDARLGTPPELDDEFATLVPATMGERLKGMLGATVRQPASAEARVLRAVLAPRSLTRDAFDNPKLGARGFHEYNEPPVRRAQLAWASATSSARGLSRAYLPFAGGGVHGGRTFFREATLSPVYARQSWSERDRILQKPLGWSQGFLKDDVFSPTRESFGHAGMGGALGWCDPVKGLAFGYVMNRMDWRVRSPRVLSLCKALYACEPVRA
jgi:CubicO group peptidase (beta-lactamase class C family)